MRKMPFYSATEHLWKEAKSRLQYSHECIFTCIFNVTLISLLQVGGKPSLPLSGRKTVHPQFKCIVLLYLLLSL